MYGRKKTPAQDNIYGNCPPSPLKGEVYQAAQDSFFENEYHDFLQLPQLISTLNHIYPFANVNNMLLRLAALMHGLILGNCLHHSGELKDPRKLVLIWDTDNSYGLKVFRSNFIDYEKYDIPVKGATNINSIIGISATLHKTIKSKGKEIFIPCVSYHITQTDVQLFSPQAYYHIHSGYYEVYDIFVSMYLTGYQIQIPILIGQTSLPIV